jgi:hypothetical protein
LDILPATGKADENEKEIDVDALESATASASKAVADFFCVARC